MNASKKSNKRDFIALNNGILYNVLLFAKLLLCIIILIRYCQHNCKNIILSTTFIFLD